MRTFLPHLRLRFLFWVFLFAALAGGFGLSRHAVAQQDAQAPAASSSNAAFDQDEAEKTTPKDEQKELDIYRHSPLVAKIGQKMGLDVETTAKLFEAINFLIIVFAIVIPLVRILPKALRNRKETLNREIQTARAATADANARLSVVEAQLAGLAGEIAKFRTQVEQDSRDDEKRIKASIGEETARIVAAAEQEITAAAAQARRGLRHFAADLAIGQAEKQLVLTPETDRALISEFIAEAGRNATGKGGSN